MGIIKVLLLITSLLILLIACTPSPGTSEVLPTYTPYPTYAPFPTYTPYPTFTPYPTIVPPTEVPTITEPAVTATPMLTATLMPTQNPELTTDKAGGVWLVGNEVAIGLWRASGDCYAVLRDKNGKSLDMASGSRSIISVTSEAFSIEFVSFPDKCTWSYLGQ